MKKHIWVYLVLCVATVLSGGLTYGESGKKSVLSEDQKQILRFWTGIAPPELVRLNKRYLPDGLRLPEEKESGKALLAFYSKWAPKKVVAMVERLAGLRYPILDTQDLKGQLGMSGGEWKTGDDRLVSNLHVSDFPVASLGKALDVAVFRELAGGFKGCWDSYNECRGEGSATAQGRCEREYQACADGVSIQIFVAMHPEIFRKKWPRWPPGPEPGPDW